MCPARDDVTVRPGDGCVKVDDKLYFVGTRCKYCKSDAAAIMIDSDDRVGPSYPVCSTHRDKVQEKDRETTAYELSKDD